MIFICLRQASAWTQLGIRDMKCADAFMVDVSERCLIHLLQRVAEQSSRK